MNDQGPPPTVPDYELLRRIGSGSYGEVWLARGVTGVYRAVKVVARSRFADERPFLRELDGISRFQQLALGHPRQLGLLHVGRTAAGDAFHYVMELADDAESGTEIDPARYVPLTLKEVRRRRGRLPAAECLRLAVELTEALGGLHALGLVHRDVKPSNIILVNGVPKLADVGLVTSAENLLTSVGTPGYLPPEGAGTERADLYSLGRVLYELLTGHDAGEFPRLPADGTDRADAALFFELNEVVLRASDTDPDDRYPSAAAMLEDLRLIQAGRSLRELSALRERLARLGRGARWVGAAAAAVIAVLGVKSHLATKRLYELEQQQHRAAEERAAAAGYAADLQVAQMSLTAGDRGAAMEALERQLPAAGARDRRGFEWRALAREAGDEATQVLELPGDGPFTQLALERSGTTLAAMRHLVTTNGPSEDGIIQLWTGEPARAGGQFADVYDLGRFTPDGGRLGASRYDKRLFTVNPTGPEARRELGGRDQLVASSADGRTVLLDRGGDRHVFTLWDVIEDREVGHWETGPDGIRSELGGVALDPGGRVIAASFFWTEGALYRRELIVYDTARAEVRFRTSDVQRVSTLRFSPDGRSLAVGMAGEPIDILDARTGASQFRLAGHAGRVEALEFSGDSRRLASGGSDGTIRIWDLVTRTELRRLQGHRAAVRDLAWYPGGERLASASDDATVRLWDLRRTGRMPVVGGLWKNTLGGFLVTSNHTRVLAARRDGTAALFDTATWAPVRDYPGVFQPLAWGTNAGEFLALGTNLDLVRVDLEQGRTVPVGLKLSPTARVVAFATSPSGRLAAFVDSSRLLTVWQLAEGRSLGTATNGRARSLALAFPPDDAFLVTGDAAGRVRRWKLPLSEPVELAACPREIHSAAVSSDGRWLALGLEDGTIRIRDLQAPAQPDRVLSGHSREVSALSFDRAGTRLVSGGYDGVLVFWTVPEFARVVGIPFDTEARPGGDHGLLPVEFTPGDAWLGAYAADGRLRFWRGR